MGNKNTSEVQTWNDNIERICSKCRQGLTSMGEEYFYIYSKNNVHKYQFHQYSNDLVYFCTYDVTNDSPCKIKNSNNSMLCDNCVRSLFPTVKKVFNIIRYNSKIHKR